MAALSSEQFSGPEIQSPASARNAAPQPGKQANCTVDAGWVDR